MTLRPVPHPSPLTPRTSSVLVWFRRDLRAYDHAALYHALRDHDRVWCGFIFDTDILQPLLDKGQGDNRRVAFIHGSLRQLDEILRARGGGLIVRHGRAVDAIPRLAADLGGTSTDQKDQIFF